MSAALDSSRAVDETEFQKTTLDNGVRILTERHPRARGVAVGFWVTCGTRDETPDIAGVSHFVEHLVFKRTKNRTAFELARALEAVGGELNAFTSRESTCFFAHCLNEHLALSIDVLADLVCRATFSKSDFEKERQVVLQEIHMTEDTPEDYIFDVYFEKCFAKSPLGRPILGTEKSIRALKLNDVSAYYHSRYTGDQIIVSVTGNVEHDEVVRLVERQLKPFVLKGKAGSRRKGLAKRDKAKLKKFIFAVERPAEQVHVLMGLPSASFRDRFRFEGYFINTLLAGGMTSKLYQSVRERRGLVYSIYSTLTTFMDTGISMIYAGTEPKHLAKVIELILKELDRLSKAGVSSSDLKLYKTQVLGQILLGADDIENRMNSLAVNEMVFGRYRAVDEVMREVDKVSLDSLDSYLKRYLSVDQAGLLLMGAVKEPTAKALFERYF